MKNGIFYAFDPKAGAGRAEHRHRSRRRARGARGVVLYPRLRRARQGLSLLHQLRRGRLDNLGLPVLTTRVDFVTDDRLSLHQRDDAATAPLCAGAARLSVLTGSARAMTPTVGPGKTYAAPCAAIAAAHAGDIIEIDAGHATTATCARARRTTSRSAASAGAPRSTPPGKNSGGKAIWVISGDDTTVENIELSGATVPDQNGAGIRQEGNEPDRARLLLPRQPGRHPRRRQRTRARSSSSTPSSPTTARRRLLAQHVHRPRQASSRCATATRTTRRSATWSSRARPRTTSSTTASPTRRRHRAATRSTCPTAARRLRHRQPHRAGAADRQLRHGDYGLEGTSRRTRAASSTWSTTRS